MIYRPTITDPAPMDMSFYNQSYYNFQSRINYDYSANNISNLLSYLPANMLAKQSSVEPNAFERAAQQAPQPIEYVKDEYISYSEQESEQQPSTATNISPKSGSLVAQSKSSEEFNDFKLDDFEGFDRTLEFDYFRVDA